MKIRQTVFLFIVAYAVSWLVVTTVRNEHGGNLMFNPATDGPIRIEKPAPSYSSSGYTCSTTVDGGRRAVLTPCLVSVGSSEASGDTVTTYTIGGGGGDGTAGTIRSSR